MTDELALKQSPLESEKLDSLPTLDSLPETYEFWETPRELRCPITQQSFKDPFIGPAGSYERDALAQWLLHQEQPGQKFPETPLSSEDNVFIDTFLARHGYVRNYRLKELLATTSEPAYFDGLFETPLMEGDAADFACPLSQDWVVEPVVAMDGQTYDKAQIEQHFATFDTPELITSPMTNQLLASCILYPNEPLRYLLEQRQGTHYVQIQKFLKKLCALEDFEEQARLLAKNTDLLVLPLPAQENVLHCLLQEKKGLDLLPTVLAAFENSQQGASLAELFAQKNAQGHSPLDKAILRLQAESSTQNQESNPQRYAALANLTFTGQENLLHLLARYRAVDTLSEVMSYLGERAAELFKQPNSEGKIPFDLLEQAFNNSAERLQLLYAAISIIKSTRQPELYRTYLDRCGWMLEALLPDRADELQRDESQDFYSLKILQELLKFAGEEWGYLLAGVRLPNAPRYSFFLALLCRGAAPHFSLLYSYMSKVERINDLIFIQNTPKGVYHTIEFYLGSHSLPLLEKTSVAHRKQIIQLRNYAGESAIDSLLSGGKCEQVKTYQTLFNLSEEDLFNLLINTKGESIFHGLYFWNRHGDQFPNFLVEHLSYQLVYRLFCHPDKEGYSALHMLFDIYTTEKEIHDLFGWLNQQDKPGENTALKLLCLQNTQNYSSAISSILFSKNPKLWFDACLTFFSPNDILTLVTAPSSKTGYANFFTLCLFRYGRIGIAAKLIEVVPNFLDLFSNIPDEKVSRDLFNVCLRIKYLGFIHLVISRLQHTPRLLSKEQRLALHDDYISKRINCMSTYICNLWDNFLNPTPLIPSPTSEIEQPSSTHPIPGNPQPQSLPMNFIQQEEPEALSSSIAKEKPLTETPLPARLPQKIIAPAPSIPVEQKARYLSPFRDCTLPLSLASTFFTAGITFSLCGIGATATVFVLPLAPKFFAIAGACFAVAITALCLSMLTLGISHFYHKYCSSDSLFFKPAETKKAALPTETSQPSPTGYLPTLSKKPGSRLC